MLENISFDLDKNAWKKALEKALNESRKLIDDFDNIFPAVSTYRAAVGIGAELLHSPPDTLSSERLLAKVFIEQKTLMDKYEEKHERIKRSIFQIEDHEIQVALENIKD